MTPKVVSTIIEDEVVYLSDADIEFVSLVKYGANRTPFKILKSQDKGGNIMSKVITAVLVPKSLDEEAVKAQLEGYRVDEMKEYDTYKSYIQVTEDAIDLDSSDVIMLDKESGVLGIVASLKGDEQEPEVKIELKTVEKEAVDYATMDNLYMELYAMADIVAGSMRQSEADKAARSKTILTAIDNFKAFAEMILTSLKENVEAVKAEDHPTLLDFIKRGEKEEVIKEESKAIDEESLKALIVEETGNLIKAEITSKFEDLTGKIAEVIDTVTGISDKVVKLSEDVGVLAPLNEQIEFIGNLPTKMKELSDGVEELKTTPVTTKSEVDEIVVDPEDEDPDFTGTLFHLKKKDTG